MSAASLFGSYPMVISTNDSIFRLTVGINSYVVGMCIHIRDVGLEVTSASLDGICAILYCQFESNGSNSRWI